MDVPQQAQANEDGSVEEAPLPSPPVDIPALLRDLEVPNHVLESRGLSWTEVSEDFCWATTIEVAGSVRIRPRREQHGLHILTHMGGMELVRLVSGLEKAGYEIVERTTETNDTLPDATHLRLRSTPKLRQQIGAGTIEGNLYMASGTKFEGGFHVGGTVLMERRSTFEGTLEVGGDFCISRNAVFIGTATVADQVAVGPNGEVEGQIRCNRYFATQGSRTKGGIASKTGVFTLSMDEIPNAMLRRIEDEDDLPDMIG